HAVCRCGMVLSVELVVFVLFISVDSLSLSPFFFFTDPATAETYTLSLHALFRSELATAIAGLDPEGTFTGWRVSALLENDLEGEDRKSTRLNSSHVKISYAVFCLKKKKPYSVI